jgi:hypothetical protein
VGVVSIGGLVVAHVSWRLLLSRTPRQCAMPRHNGNFLCSTKEREKKEEKDGFLKKKEKKRKRKMAF